MQASVRQPRGWQDKKIWPEVDFLVSQLGLSVSHGIPDGKTRYLVSEIYALVKMLPNLVRYNDPTGQKVGPDNV